MEHPSLVYSILTLTNTHPFFYPKMGPYLAQRSIVKELGAPIFDDDGKVWHIACTSQGAVMGFAAMIEKSSVYLLCHDYVLPAYREMAEQLYGDLIESRLTHVPGACSAVVVAAPNMVDTYQQKGFLGTRKRGRFTEMVRKGAV